MLTEISDRRTWRVVLSFRISLRYGPAGYQQNEQRRCIKRLTNGDDCVKEAIGLFTGFGIPVH